MAIFNEKFNEVKTLIEGEFYPQAKDECDNGVSACLEAQILLENLLGKFVDKGCDEETVNALHDFKVTYFG